MSGPVDAIDDPASPYVLGKMRAVDAILHADACLASGRQLCRAGDRAVAQLRAQRRWRWMAPLAAAAAACLVIGWWLAAGAAPDHPRLIVDRGSVLIVDDDAAVLAVNGAPVAVGSMVQVGPGASAALRYRDGSVARIAADSEVRVGVDGGKFLFVERGAVDCAVEPQPAGKPLVVATPLARATVVGTRFRIAVEAGEASLSVSEGLVRFARTGDATAIDVAAGFASQTKRPGPLVAERTDRPARGGAFVAVADFGAVGDGIADDTASIQRAVSSAIGADGAMATVLLESSARYRITAPLLVADVTGGRIVGNGATLLWDGPSDDAALVMRAARRTVVEDLTITTLAPLDAAIRCDSGLLPGKSGDLVLRNLTIDAGSSSLAVGVRVTAGSASDWECDNDFHLLDRVAMTGYSEAGVLVAATTARNVRLFGCTFVARPDAPFSCCVRAVRSVVVHGGTGRGSTDADFRFDDPQQVATITGWSSTGSRRLLITSASSSAPFPVRIADSSFISGQLAEDRCVIDLRFPGPLVIEDTVLGSGVAPLPRIRLGAPVPTALLMDGVTFGAIGSAFEEPVINAPDTRSIVVRSRVCCTDEQGQPVMRGDALMGAVWDGSGASSTRPAPVGPTLPDSCTLGDVFFCTGSAPGGNLHVCLRNGRWSQLGRGVGEASGQSLVRGTDAAPESAALPTTATPVADASQRYATNPPAVRAVGDGVADDSASLQEALRSAGSSQPVVLRAHATYRITTPLVIDAPGTRLVGNGATVRWSGDATSPAVIIRDAAGARLTDLRIRAEDDAPLAQAVHLEATNDAPATAADIVIASIRISGSGVDTAIAVVDGRQGSVGPPVIIRDAAAQGHGGEFLRIESGRSVRALAIHSFPEPYQQGTVGIHVVRGAVELIGGHMRGHGDADVRLTAPTAPVTIADLISTNARALLVTDEAAASAPVVILGGYWSLLEGQPTLAIDYALPARLRIENLVIGGFGAMPRLALRGEASALMRGNLYQTLGSHAVDPFLPDAAGMLRSELDARVDGRGAVEVGGLVRITRPIDFAAADGAKPIALGTTAPPDNQPGDLFLRVSDQGASEVLVCTAQGAWTPLAAEWGTETPVPDRAVKNGAIDASRAHRTRPARCGLALPARAQVGEWFVKLDAPVGRNLYVCTAVDQWSEVR
ncbi:MAG: FecR domain-containing protein [Planctomycetes bacterium]|nr:FecR domain-containing protein [Planctomycetota bacterium]